MKTIQTTSFAECHSGHGKPGLFHSHEEWMASGTLVLVVLAVLFAILRK